MNKNQTVAHASGKKLRLAYILAASHSGSTLLAMLLGAHPEVCTAGELKLNALGDIENYLCSCREKVRECPFWNAISRDMAQRGHPFDIAHAGTDFQSSPSRYVRRLVRPLHRGRLLELLRDGALALSPRWRAALPRIQATNTALAECILSRTGKRILVDSSKVGLRLKYLLRNPALDVRVIRLIRDGRGVALTYMDPARFADARDPRLREGGTGGSREGERLSIAEAAREWRRSNEEAETILKTLDRSAWHEIRYEDLCAEPDRTLAELFAFIGADPARASRDFRSVEHHIIGNGMRLDSTSEIRLDERWKTALTDKELRIFETVAGETNRRLGYS